MSHRLTGAEGRLLHPIPERDIVSVLVSLEENLEQGVGVFRGQLAGDHQVSRHLLRYAGEILSLHVKENGT